MAVGFVLITNTKEKQREARHKIGLFFFGNYDIMDKERKDLINQKKTGRFNIHHHLNDHPIGRMVKLGMLRPSDKHPLMRLK